MSRLMIDIAYEIAKKEYSDNEFSFVDLWDKIKSKLRIKPKDSNNIVGDFYAELIQDVRFTIFNQHNMWKLSEFLSDSEKENLHKQLFKFSNDTIYEDGYGDKISSSENIYEKKLNSKDESVYEEYISDEFGYDINEHNGYSDMDEEYLTLSSSQNDEDEEE